MALWARARSLTPRSALRSLLWALTSLAAGIGNIHGVYPENWKGLDFEALDRIHQATNNIPWCCTAAPASPMR